VGFLAFLGNTTSLERYSLRRSTLRSKPSAERFLRRWSTQMPMVGASVLEMPAALHSLRVKPRPILFLRLYLMVWPATTGRRAPATGRGNTLAALAARAASDVRAGKE